MNFFLYLSFYAVHDPIEGRADLVNKYEEKLKQMTPLEEPPYILEGNPDAPDPVSKVKARELPQYPEYQGLSQLPNQIVKIKHHQNNVEFASMVEWMDENVGRVQAKLEELGLDKNTIVIFVSDNGGMAAANFGRPNRVITEEHLDRAFSTLGKKLSGKRLILPSGKQQYQLPGWEHNLPYLHCRSLIALNLKQFNLNYKFILILKKNAL